MSMYNRISDRTRLLETVQVRMKSAPRVSSTVSISYINHMKVGGTVCKPCKCPVNRVKVVLIVLGRNRPY